MGENFKKIDEVEIAIGVGFSLLVWFLCALLDAVGIGLVVSPIIESFFTFGMWWFFKNHGDPHSSRFGANFAMYASNLIPFLPAIVASFIIKTVIHNHQNLIGAVGKVASIASKI
ncbi:MAG: hypothetical protein ABSF47_02110 [Minisyncoccia bacterium]|jgi:hypothetical protein